MKILLCDNSIIVCEKPAGALSPDEPGGVPELARAALGDPGAEVRTVHRLDRVVGGAMLLARTKAAATALGRQVMDHRFEKEYLAVVHGAPPDSAGTFRDLLRRDKAERKTYVTDTPGKDAREAILDYRLLGSRSGLSLLHIRLQTGRTHQIRCQCASRGLPLVGDRKYGLPGDESPIALWSYRLAFDHPETGERVELELPPPGQWPWTEFTLE